VEVEEDDLVPIGKILLAGKGLVLRLGLLGLEATV